MFQSTPACERATRAWLRHDGGCNVSIHARVRAGDFRLVFLRLTLVSFNPRPRASGRLAVALAVALRVALFQSTPACERATCFQSPNCQDHLVSIHARVRAGDDRGQRPAHRRVSFNPRPRASGRPAISDAIAAYADVSIHARVRAGDATCTIAGGSATVSIHARVRAGDIRRGSSSLRPYSFNPRPRASGRLHTQRHSACRCDVSIHARVRAGDAGSFFGLNEKLMFQSTPACERATSGQIHPNTRFLVSIHARVRAGDQCDRSQSHEIKRFNPRPRASGRPP